MVWILTSLSIQTDANAILSQDGVIQNVQNYSTNPFWKTGNSAYAQRMPTAVYATGPAIETSNCQTIVTALVSSLCAQNNNCTSMRLSDIRPTIMLQLSRLPNGNYATACSGYLDGAFDNYIKTYGKQVSSLPATPPAQVQFPTPTSFPAPATQIAQNPQDWQSELMKRKLELQEFQSTNGANNIGLQAAAFPKTYSDLSFEQRAENAAQGYEPYQGKSAFVQIEFEDEATYLKRKEELAIMRDILNLTNEEFCEKHPTNERCKQVTAEAENRENIIKALSNALQEAKQ